MYNIVYKYGQIFFYITIKMDKIHNHTAIEYKKKIV